jgi:hypothetical protein
MKLQFTSVLTAALASMLVACGGGGGGGGGSTTTTPPPAATAPTITTQPTAQTAAAGATATFTVAASGTAPLSYQWQANGTAIAGATSASYTTAALAAGDNGISYTVVVTNSAGSVTSSAALLTVTTPTQPTAPTITTQPVAVTAAVGATATFTVVATGTAPLSYQWYANGTIAIAGATSATYTTAALAAGDNGISYTVVVTNSAGSVTSSAAVLTVTTSTGTVTPGPDVVTFKYDTTRSGANSAETILTPTNVNTTTFGLLRNLPADGVVDAQPLYLGAVTIAGVVHNVVYMATEHGSVYAYDADSTASPATPLWKVSLVGSGESTSDDFGCSEISPEIGITSTPVIDRTAGANGTIFVVAMTKDASSAYHQRLHALDLTTGAELSGGPTEITASFTFAGAVNAGTTTFVPAVTEERTALLLANGIIYTTWSSHCDAVAPGYDGWVIAYNESNITQASALNLGPGSQIGGGGNGATVGPGIWMSGSGPAVDSAGFVYLATGNGPHETTLQGGDPNGGDYGNSAVSIQAPGGQMSVYDYFFPLLGNTQSASDIEIGSGGVVLFPDMVDSGGTTRQLMAAAGKDGNIYVMERQNMGEYQGVHDNVWQKLSGALNTAGGANTGGIWGSPAYWQGLLYYGEKKGPLKAFAFSQAMLTLHQTGTATYAFPGASPSISANGANTPILWTQEQVYDVNNNPSYAILHAYDGDNIATELYNSQQNATRDSYSVPPNHFITPMVTGGQVYMGTNTSVAIFGLLPP